MLPTFRRVRTFPDDIVDHLAGRPQIQTAGGPGEPPLIQLVNSVFFLEKTGNLVFCGEKPSRSWRKTKGLDIIYPFRRLRCSSAAGLRTVPVRAHGEDRLGPAADPRRRTSGADG